MSLVTSLYTFAGKKNNIEKNKIEICKFAYLDRILNYMHMHQIVNNKMLNTLLAYGSDKLKEIMLARMMSI